MNLRTHQKETIEVMRTTPKGQIIVPTGGGKTLCMIKDTIEEFNGNSDPKTIVVVAPRILLAEQLCQEFEKHVDGVDILHVHSGETDHKSSTNFEEIIQWWHNSYNLSLIHI